MVEKPDSVALSRAVRFSVPLSPAGGQPLQGHAGQGLRFNSFAGQPSMRGLGLYAEWIVTVTGTPNAQTGYLLNISEIDRAVREGVVPIVAAAVQARGGGGASPASILRAGVASLRGTMGETLAEARWKLTPYYSLAMSAADTDHIRIMQSFEFAAAHRLHCDDLDDAANRAIFGKCNNPSGHGHNYRVEVEVAAPFAAVDGGAFTLQTLEGIVAERVIQRFDHTHLNRDVPEFAHANPSVERITRVCHDLLQQPLREAGATLVRVTVWETEKTACTYPA